jgi:hypothetical protein
MDDKNKTEKNRKPSLDPMIRFLGNFIGRGCPARRAEVVTPSPRRPPSTLPMIAAKLATKGWRATADLMSSAILPKYVPGPRRSQRPEHAANRTLKRDINRTFGR